jgi:hypothetical protein
MNLARRSSTQSSRSSRRVAAPSGRAWQARATNSACLAGLTVRVPGGRPPPPNGLTLDASTGTIRSTMPSHHIDGWRSRPRTSCGNPNLTSRRDGQRRAVRTPYLLESHRQYRLAERFLSWAKQCLRKCGEQPLLATPPTLGPTPSTSSSRSTADIDRTKAARTTASH